MELMRLKIFWDSFWKNNGAASVLFVLLERGFAAPCTSKLVAATKGFSFVRVCTYACMYRREGYSTYMYVGTQHATTRVPTHIEQISRSVKA